MEDGNVAVLEKPIIYRGDEDAVMADKTTEREGTSGEMGSGREVLDEAKDDQRKKPIFGLIKLVEERLSPVQLDRLLCILRKKKITENSSVGDLAEHRPEDLLIDRRDKYVVKQIERVLEEKYDIQLKPSLKVPISRLLGLISGDGARQELGIFAKFAGIKNISEFVARQEGELIGRGLSRDTVQAAGRVLTSKFGINYGAYFSNGKNAKNYTDKRGELRGYLIEDRENCLVVNGNNITISTRGNRGKKNHVNCERLFKLYSLHSAGKKVCRISEELGLDSADVAYWLKKAGVYPIAKSRASKHGLKTKKGDK